jgi:chitin synthase
MTILEGIFLREITNNPKSKCGVLLPTAVVKFLQDLQESRYFTFLFVSVWKIVCFFCIMLLATHSQFDSLGVEDLFNLFSETFSRRSITVTEVRTTFTDIQENKLFV